MPNPIQERMGNNPSGPFGNMQNMVNQFNQFRSQFQGDPKAQVQELLNSGRMSQEQFNQLSNLANQFQNLIGRR